MKQVLPEQASISRCDDAQGHERDCQLNAEGGVGDDKYSQCDSVTARPRGPLHQVHPEEQISVDQPYIDQRPSERERQILELRLYEIDDAENVEREDSLCHPPIP